MYESSKDHPPEAGEFEKARLTFAPARSSGPWVWEAGVSMERLLDRILSLSTDHLIVGRMVRFHVRDELYENGRIDVPRPQPLGRLAGNYQKVETIFEVPSEASRSLRRHLWAEILVMSSPRVWLDDHFFIKCSKRCSPCRATSPGLCTLSG
jgi:hypothetical protein